MSYTVTPSLFTDEILTEWFAKSESTNYGKEANKHAVYIILNGIIKRAETHINVLLQWSNSFSENLAPVGKRLYPTRLPIANVESIQAFHDYEFAATNLVSSDAYFVEENSIILKGQADWGHRRYLVTYAGGYSPFGADPYDYASEGYSSTPLPDDLAQAILTQLNFEYANRTKAGIDSVTDRTGSVTRSQPLTWLPMVREVLDSYRREFIPA